MKFKLLTLCSVLVLTIQSSFHATSNIQDFVTNLTTIYHKDSSSKQKKVDFEDEFKKFIADGGNLNEIFIDPETGASTTPLFFSINNQLLYLTFLSLKYGADPLLLSVGDKSSIDYVADEYLHDFFGSPPVVTYPVSEAVFEFEQNLRVINFALLLSYVPKDKKKQVLDGVLQKIVHGCKLHEILIDELVEDLQEDFSEFSSDDKEMKKEFKNYDSGERILIAFGLLNQEARKSILYTYLEFLPDDEQAKYLQNFQLPKPHAESLEKSKWFQFAALYAGKGLSIVCA